jgi:phosphatidylinositol glycan class Z
MSLYGVFVVLRLVFLFTEGYIHPDEFFQGPQVTYGDIFNKNITIPWEFTVEQQIRSITPMYTIISDCSYLISGLPFLVIKFFGISSPRVLLYFPRLVLFVFSLFVDRMVSAIGSGYKSNVLVLFSSFWPVIVFHTRTFSNTSEIFLLALAFYIFFRV